MTHWWYRGQAAVVGGIVDLCLCGASASPRFVFDAACSPRFAFDATAKAAFVVDAQAAERFEFDAGGQPRFRWSEDDICPCT